ncbi:MAG: hypothetical protein LUI09_05605 [Prevotellaceae bacterium]|nr:hypothetical protein [Prevotellaceae bacterium]
MKARPLLMLATLCAALFSQAQNAPQGGGGGGTQAGSGQRTFEIIVKEDAEQTNTRDINWETQQRGFLSFGSNMFSLYRTAVAEKFSNSSTNIISQGINFLYQKLASHRQDWMQAVQKECTYTKNLAMQTEVVDFYREPSTYGALDPTGIVFTGFGCRQYTTGEASSQTGQPTAVGGGQQGATPPQGGGKAEGTPSDTVPVFYIFCNLLTDDLGQMHIINHGKFMVEVDSIYFNPFACNLPNDSTAATGTGHIDFDFHKRKDLVFTLTANITSSWMNEAIQVYRDVPLGEFKVTVRIDSAALNKAGVFTYDRNHEDSKKAKEKYISVEGESFIVPRSYVGMKDTISYASLWGTGQYKINMVVSESCSINQEFYLEKQDSTATKQMAQGDSKQGKKQKKQKQKWNDEWKKEWKIIKARQHSSSFWDTVKEQVVSEWRGNEWITTIIEPASSSIISGVTETLGGDSNTNGNGKAGQGNQTGDNPMPF